MIDDKSRSGGEEDLSDFFTEDDFVGEAGAKSKPVSKPEREPTPEPASKPKSETKPKPETSAEDDKSKDDEADEKEAVKDDEPGKDGEREGEPAAGSATDTSITKQSSGPSAIVRYGLPIAAFFLISLAAIFFSKPSGEELLKDAAASFGEIESGIFDFAITISPRGQSGAQPATISLSGPFQLNEGDKLPTARVEYTVSAGGAENKQTLIMTGDKAYVEFQGQAYELPEEATKDLAKASDDLRKSDEGKSAGLGGIDLDLDQWLEDPKVTNGGKVGGQKTWQVDAGVDIVEAMTDLIAQSKALGTVTGSELPAQLSKQDAKELRKLIKNAYVRVNVGRYDRLLRRFDLTMDIEPPADGKSKTPISSGRANVIIGITDPNQPVEVEPPADPLPFSALQSLTQGATPATGGR